MNKNLIKQLVLRDKRYSFPVENGLYIAPTYVHGFSGNVINLSKPRELSKTKGNSVLVNNFKKDIIELRKSWEDSKKRYLVFASEFPFPIEDVDLWNMLLTREGVPLEEKDLRGIRYFLLDIFFYYSGLIVEVDFNYSDRKRIYEKTKDKYLRIKYNLETCRISNYGNSSITDKYDKDYIKDVIEEKIKGRRYNLAPFPLDFSKTIIDNFIRDNKKPLDLIEKIKNYLKELFTYHDKLVITKADLEKIDPYTFVTGLRRDQESVLINSVVNLIKDIYGKELIITESSTYSLGDVLSLVEKIRNGQFTWNDYTGRIIKPWMTKLVGFPPPEYTTTDNVNYKISINNEIEGDGGIDKFLILLEKARIISPL